MTDRRMISTQIYECSVAWRLGSEHPDLLGIAAQRVFEMLILLADDHGRGRYIPALIRVKAFSTTKEVLDEITDEQIDKWVKIMVEEGAVELYEVGGQKYYSMTGWSHYQRGNWRPQKSNIPAPGQLLFDTKRDKSGVKSGSKGREEKLKEKKENTDTRQKTPGARVKVGPITDVLERDRAEYPEIYAFIQELFPDVWTDKPKELKAQADALRLIVYQDTNGPTETIFDILRWAHADIIPGAGRGEWQGWGVQFKSFRGLRRKRDGVSKFEKIWAAYRASLGKKKTGMCPKPKDVDLAASEREVSEVNARIAKEKREADERQRKNTAS